MKNRLLRLLLLMVLLFSLAACGEGENDEEGDETEGQNGEVIGGEAEEEGEAEAGESGD